MLQLAQPSSAKGVMLYITVSIVVCSCYKVRGHHPRSRPPLQ